MYTFPHSTRWLLKPPSGVQINWGNPLTNGLVFFSIPDKDHPNNLVAPNSLGTLLSSTSYTGTTRLGSGAISTNSTSGGLYYPWTPFMNTLTNYVTILVWLIPTSIPAYGIILCVPYAAGPSVSPYTCVGLQQYASSTSGLLNVGLSGTSRTATSNAGFIQTSDTLTCYACTVNTISGAVIFYRNGILWTSTSLSGTGSITWTNQQPVTLLNQSNSAPNTGIAGTTPYAAMWNRVLSSQEMEQLFIDPYSIMQSQVLGKQYFLTPNIAGQQQLSLFGCGY